MGPIGEVGWFRWRHTGTARGAFSIRPRFYLYSFSITPLALAEVELVASDAEVFNDVGDDAAWHIAWMPGKGDEPVGLERIGVMPVATRRAEQFAADFPEPPL
jgi:hypothetical protein